MIAAVTVIGGLAIGVALTKLSGSSDSSTDTIGRSIQPHSATTRPTRKLAASAPRRGPVTGLRIRVVSAILHPAGTASGQARNRARVSVHVRVVNSSGQRVVLSRPTLVSGPDRVRTDRRQDTSATSLRALAPGATGDATFRFELSGPTTLRVRNQLRIRVIVGGRNVGAPVTVGRPVSIKPATQAGASSGTATQPTPTQTQTQPASPTQTQPASPPQTQPAPPPRTTPNLGITR